MPRTSTITSASSTSGYTIDPYIYSLSFKMYGASGGGENILGNTSLTRTAGTSGGTTSFLGFTLTGGVGGGVSTKNAGGQGGVATEGFTWSGAGTSVSSANGNRGSLPTGGIGAYAYFMAKVLELNGVDYTLGLANGTLQWFSQFLIVLVLGGLSLILLPIINKQAK